METALTVNRLPARALGTIGISVLGVVLLVRQGFTADADLITEAFDWTVVFLMVTPYAILVCCVGWMAYRYARARRTREGRQDRLHVVKKGEC